ncbi:DUF4190 domain-containing protein [Streptomyces sp. SAS_270]|uniref:DUF4190 domain-containing protein n=1 Tax=Streptomyces sp. SAS_270 TaxID=3412748 RepID=UPI00403C8086
MAIPPPPGQQQPEGSYPPPYPHYPQYPQGGGPYDQGGPYQQPYGGTPYAPWGQGYSPFNRPVPVNGLAISALVLGILCFLPAVGLVLGAVALRQIKKRGERGKGMAVGGMVMSSVGVVLLVVALVTGGARDFWDGFRDAADDSRGSGGSAFSLDKGDCIDAPGDALEGMAYDVETVPCSGRHDAEVFANFEMDDGSYPGDNEVTDAADDKCYTLQDTYAMDVWALPGDVDVYYFTPTRQSWRLGDREVTCMFGNTDEAGTLTGSLRNDATTLDADQVAYLQAAHLLNSAMNSAPDEEYVEDDLPGHKEWADRMSHALTEQTGTLRGHTWPDAVAGPMAALVKNIGLSQGEWAKAADAKNPDAFYAHYEKAMKYIDPRKTVTTRKALGLATTPPAYDEDGGDQSGGGGDTGIEV